MEWLAESLSQAREWLNKGTKQNKGWKLKLERDNNIGIETQNKSGEDEKPSSNPAKLVLKRALVAPLKLRFSSQSRRIPKSLKNNIIIFSQTHNQIYVTIQL